MADDIQSIPRAAWDELAGGDETPNAEWAEADQQIGIAFGFGTWGLWLWGRD